MESATVELLGQPVSLRQPRPITHEGTRALTQDQSVSVSSDKQLQGTGRKSY